MSVCTSNRLRVSDLILKAADMSLESLIVRMCLLSSFQYDVVSMDWTSICHLARRSCDGSAASLGKSELFWLLSCLTHHFSSRSVEESLGFMCSAIHSVTFCIDRTCISAMAWKSDLVGPILGACPMLLCVEAQVGTLDVMEVSSLVASFPR